ncbi:hypothetical protein B0A49_13256 [Cryomyces minteri]|uniref:HAT C-terminal dimerisation domain-containing protein n=1 Tax=Cryomyces minteri TaxID=331657 RepID=A0A4U0VS43_9PEZI|nr:hypothetical protein B0A49_13256 [Cryomyces minteri]
MKSLFQEYVANEQSEQEEEPAQNRYRKLPAAVIRSHEKARQLGLIDSDDEDENLHQSHLRVDEEYSTHRTKGRRIESELQKYYDEGLESNIVDDPLKWWIKRSNDPRNPYPILTRMAMDLFSIPATTVTGCPRR